MILNLADDVEVSLILGRPFLATYRTLIDVSDGTMVLRIEDEEVVFRLLDAMRHSLNSNGTCHFIEATDHIVYFVQEMVQVDLLVEFLDKDDSRVNPTQFEKWSILKQKGHPWLRVSEVDP